MPQKPVKVFEAYPGMYQHSHLPAFARFVMQHKLNEFAKFQLEFSIEIKLPLLLALSKRYSREQMLQIAMMTSQEYLQFLVDNKSYEQVMVSMERWLKDSLDVIGKFEISAQDITLFNYVREQSLKRFIPDYTNDLNEAMAISNEIDTLVLGMNTTAIDIYVNILKEKISEQSNFSSAIIEASPAISFVFDLQQDKEIFVSGKVEEVMGYTPEELLTKDENILLQLAHPEHKRSIIRLIQNIVQKNDDSTNVIEYRFRHKDGSYRWLRTYTVIFKREEGKPVQLMGKTFDITKEKETAIALEKREQQLLDAQAIAHIGSFEWNIQDNTSTYSVEIIRIFELEGTQKFEEFLTHVHPEDVPKVQAALEVSFQSGVYDCEYRYRKSSTEKVIWSLGKVLFENNVPVKMIGTVQDITAIKKIEKELLQKTSALEESNENLQQFAFIASHDLQEPLRKINMFTDMILTSDNESISERSRNNILKIQRSSQAMRRMVEDILAFSSLEGKMAKEKYSLQKIIREVLELLEQNIEEKKAVIETDDLPDANVIPSQFRQLFQNLISNSIKFSHKSEPPVISIKHEWINDPINNHVIQSDRYLKITFSDNGIGFAKEQREAIFDLFKRLHAKADYEGSGLGLAIAKKIMENHGGSITAESINKQGAVFTLILPQ